MMQREAHKTWYCVNHLSFVVRFELACLIYSRTDKIHCKDAGTTEARWTKERRLCKANIVPKSEKLWYRNTKMPAAVGVDDGVGRNIVNDPVIGTNGRF